MDKIIVFVLLLSLSSVLGNPVYTEKDSALATHTLKRRFINPTFELGSNADDTYSKMRTKRSAEDDCEKLQLCKLHASSSRSFIAAFELYFVNKENAKLWDHRARSTAACERRFSGCYYRK